MSIKELREKREKGVKYWCRYCSTVNERYTFKRKEPGSSGGGTKGWGRHSAISDQVVCPNCGNFLKTWEAKIK